MRVGQHLRRAGVVLKLEKRIVAAGAFAYATSDLFAEVFHAMKSGQITMISRWLKF